jgi:acetylornithine deacetylase/succinyl-diaminopimelate desuccinylase-like protein
MDAETPIYRRPIALLQKLIQFDTSNPPGREGPCIAYVNDLLTQAGFITTLVADPATPDRPNLITRLPGRGQAPPLLLHAHADVVVANAQEWAHPPFAGEVADGFLWGRGTLDNKGGLVMNVAALLRAKAEGLAPAGDVIMAVLCDEEAGSPHGAKYLVENHAGLFRDVRYAIGEFGGFTYHLGGKRFYPIQVAETQNAPVRITMRGPGGHSSVAARGGAIGKLGHVLSRLDKHRLPVHVTPSGAMMLSAMAAALPGPMGLAIRLLMVPALTDHILDLLGPRTREFEPLLHNMAHALRIRGADHSGIPVQIDLGLSGKILPGYGPDDLRRELRVLLGPDVDIEVTAFHPGPSHPDMSLYDTLASIIREGDAGGIPIPYMAMFATDGRFFSRLGIQHYGFTPTKLPKEISVGLLAHGVDERIPVDAVAYGADAIFTLLQRYGVTS